MNIDDRLKALLESLKLQAAAGHRYPERTFQEQAVRFQKQFAQHELLFGQIALRLREVGDRIDSLARIAGAPGQSSSPL
jgi:hypothetical protein